jgi:hypothetical protein
MRSISRFSGMLRTEEAAVRPTSALATRSSDGKGAGGGGGRTDAPVMTLAPTSATPAAMCRFSGVPHRCRPRTSAGTRRFSGVRRRCRPRCLACRGAAVLNAPPFQVIGDMHSPSTSVQYSGRFAEVRLELGTPLRQGLRQSTRILGAEPTAASNYKRADRVADVWLNQGIERHPSPGSRVPFLESEGHPRLERQAIE